MDDYDTIAAYHRCCLLARGFCHGIAHFPGLNIDASLPENHYFRNDGAVKSVKEHFVELLKESGHPVVEDNVDKYENALGMHRRIERGRDDNGNPVAKASVIFIEKTRDKYVNMFSWGHESTHALIYHGLEECLLKALRESGFQIDPFKEYGLKNEEGIAHVGGWLALVRNFGTSVRESIFFTDPDQEIMKYGFDLYCSGIRSRSR